MSTPRRVGQRGQILIMFLVFLIPMTMITLSVYNVGVAASERMKLQNAADNAAYSAATYEARYMNLTAYINRAMIANYDTTALLVGVWSFLDAFDGFIYLAHFVIQKIPIINALDAVLAPLHFGIHTADDAVSQVVGGNSSGSQRRLAFAIEQYTRLLSFAQEGLYVAAQLGRPGLVRAVARGVDPGAEVFEGSELAFNITSLDGYRKWQGDTAFTSSELADKDDGLRLTIERSLNDLSNGGSFRDLRNFPIIGQIIGALNMIPCLDFNIGPHGFNGPGFDHVNGFDGPSSAAENNPDGDAVRIVEDKRIYQLDESNFKVDFDCLVSFNIIDIGHKSDDRFNLPNAANLSVPHVFDTNDGGGQGHSKDFIEPNVGSCNDSSGSVNAGGGAPPSPEMVKLGQNCQNNVNVRFVGFDKQVQTNPPESDPDKQTFISCSVVENELEKSKPSSTGNFSQGDCATVYNFETKLQEVKYTTFVQHKFKSGGSDAYLLGQRVAGPGIFVYLRKQGGLLPLARGLGLDKLTGGFNDIEVRSFGRAYYQQRPDRSGEEESFSNPFWVGRLETPFKGTDE